MTTDTTARVLRLLSLLQTRREWSGADLADRLGVTVRTIRRDIDRLRALGNLIDSARGHTGGYRLAAGTGHITDPVPTGRRSHRARFPEPTRPRSSRTACRPLRPAAAPSPPSTPLPATSAPASCTRAPASSPSTTPPASSTPPTTISPASPRPSLASRPTTPSTPTPPSSTHLRTPHPARPAHRELACPARRQYALREEEVVMPYGRWGSAGRAPGRAPIDLHLRTVSCPRAQRASSSFPT